MIPATLSKHLDLLVVQNWRHCAGGEFGPRRLRDSFHHHLTGVEPPIVEGNTIHDNKFGGVGYLGPGVGSETIRLRRNLIYSNGWGVISGPPSGNGVEITEDGLRRTGLCVNRLSWVRAVSCRDGTPLSAQPETLGLERRRAMYQELGKRRLPASPRVPSLSGGWAETLLGSRIAQRAESG
jgi:hypothetical protein